MTDAREFDLNIQRVLESWTIAHAIRELIANALDEAVLSGSQEPAIVKGPDGRWHITDFGRGLRYEHLTQNENREKLANPDKVVGKFGVGLKDALATFDRRKVSVRIRSRYGEITTAKQLKHGFDDITTLHAVIEPSGDPEMVGTDVELAGVRDADVEEAKSLFRHYAGDEVLESTAYGLVLAKARRAPGAGLGERAPRCRGEELPLLVRHHIADQSSPSGPQSRALECRPRCLHRSREGHLAGGVV
jgi:hypothetical protein